MIRLSKESGAMQRSQKWLEGVVFIILTLLAAWTAGAAPPALTMAEIISQAPAADWRTIDPDNTLFLDLATGRVMIELAPGFAPNHVANIKLLAKAGFFDGLTFVRAQDNYVVQFGDAGAKRNLGGAKRTLTAEFSRAFDSTQPFTVLSDVDTYAPQTGFADGFPAARDPVGRRSWLTHCYGMVGAGRGNDADSGGGPELYAVIGHSPRQLDRNVTLVGRVVKGMELLSVMPRGGGEMGFYQTPAEQITIKGLGLIADLPAAERIRLQALRTDSPSFAALVQSRRFRQDAWYKMPAGHIDVCNMPLPVRSAP